MFFCAVKITVIHWYNIGDAIKILGDTGNLHTYMKMQPVRHT